MEDLPGVSEDRRMSQHRRILHIVGHDEAGDSFGLSLFGGQPPVHGACVAPAFGGARRYDDTTTTTLRTQRATTKAVVAIPGAPAEYQRLSPLAATTALRAVVERSEGQSDHK
jgi:hypothetical protein